MGIWHLYLLDCTGGGIYVGIAKDVDARFAEHLAGCGALKTHDRLFRGKGSPQVAGPGVASSAEADFQVDRLR